MKDFFVVKEILNPKFFNCVRNDNSSTGCVLQNFYLVQNHKDQISQTYLKRFDLTLGLVNKMVQLIPKYLGQVLNQISIFQKQEIKNQLQYNLNFLLNFFWPVLKH